MKVVGVETFGGPRALAVHEVPEVHAGAGSVRIAVRAFAVNPTDTGVRAGERDSSKATAPYVPGMDAAGVIDEVGPDVEGWSVGDEVMAIALPLTGHGGAYVEYLVAPVGSFTRIPRGTTIEEASTVPMNGLTAIQMLEPRRARTWADARRDRRRRTPRQLRRATRQGRRHHRDR